MSELKAREFKKGAVVEVKGSPWWLERELQRSGLLP